MRWITAVLTGLVAVVGSPGGAAGQSVPHVFENGAPAVAAQVNENFSALLDAVLNPGRTTFRSGAASVLISDAPAGLRGNVGFLETRDEDDAPVARATALVEGDGGAIALFDRFGNALLTLGVANANDPEQASGAIWIEDSDRNLVVRVGRDDDGGGLIEVCDPSGETCSRISSEEKNFLAAHPSFPGSYIKYAAVEGPDVGIYLRGTAQLVRGRALVDLPEHFRLLAAPEGMTVALTPHSGSSRGLAGRKLSPGRLEVEELRGGVGSYAFDYVVHATRKGFEGREVTVEIDRGGESSPPEAERSRGRSDR